MMAGWKVSLILNKNQKSSNPWTAVQTLFEVVCWQLAIKFWSLVLTFQAQIALSVGIYTPNCKNIVIEKMKKREKAKQELIRLKA